MLTFLLPCFLFLIGLCIPVPSPPENVEYIFDYLDSVPECESDDDDGEAYESISDEPKLWMQSELNDLVNDLNLLKDSAQVLGSRFKKKNASYWYVVFLVSEPRKRFYSVLFLKRGTCLY